MRLCQIAACACAWLWLVPAAAAQIAPTQPGPGGIDRLVNAIERAAAAGDADGLLAMSRVVVEPSAFDEFVRSMTVPKATRIAVKERDRAPLDAGRVRLILETLTDRDAEGRVTTWRVDVEPTGPAADVWRVIYVERLGMISGLYRLALDTTTEYDVKNLVIRAPDLTLSLPAGQAFLSKTRDGTTALVLLGRGRLEFSPKAEAERGQVRIFAGAEVLKGDFDALFVRVPPQEFDTRVAAETSDSSECTEATRAPAALSSATMACTSAMGRASTMPS